MMLSIETCTRRAKQALGATAVAAAMLVTPIIAHADTANEARIEALERELEQLKLELQSSQRTESAQQSEGEAQAQYQTALPEGRLGEELAEFLAANWMEPGDIAWASVSGNSLRNAQFKNVVFLGEAGSDDDAPLMVDKMAFHAFERSDDEVYYEVTFTGLRDEQGVHILLSEEAMEEGSLTNLGYEQLEPLVLDVKQRYGKSDGLYEGEIKFTQSEVASYDVAYKVDGLEPLRAVIKQGVTLDEISDEDAFGLLMGLNVHYLRQELRDFGLIRYLHEEDPELREVVVELMAICPEFLNEFGLSAINDKGLCEAVNAFALGQADRLRIDINPAEPVSFASLLTTAAMLEMMGPIVVGAVLDELIERLNLEVSN